MSLISSLLPFLRAFERKRRRIRTNSTRLCLPRFAGTAEDGERSEWYATRTAMDRCGMKYTRRFIMFHDLLQGRGGGRRHEEARAAVDAFSSDSSADGASNPNSDA